MGRDEENPESQQLASRLRQGGMAPNGQKHPSRYEDFCDCLHSINPQRKAPIMSEERKQLIARLIAARETYEATARQILNQLQSWDHTVDLTTHPNRLPGMTPTFLRAILLNSERCPQSQFSQLETIVLRIEYASSQPLAGIGFAIYSEYGARVGGFSSYMASPPPHRIPMSGTYSFSLPAKQLMAGRYYLNLSIATHQTVLLDKVDTCLWFTIMGPECEGLINLNASCEIIPAESVS
jgi:Wzt C-terminal domain